MLPEHALVVENPHKDALGPLQVDTSDAGVCPGDIENTVSEPVRGVRAHAEVVPCGVSVATAKRQAQALMAEAAQMALFAKAKMSDMPVGCPRLKPRIWKAKIA